MTISSALRLWAVSTVFSAILSVSGVALADQDSAYLDPPYRHLRQPRAEHSPRFGVLTTLPRRSNAREVVEMQTPVRAQLNRGTCSIFSSTAMLEAMLVIKRGYSNGLDLSEEWLEYLIMRDRTSDGSNSFTNFDTLMAQGSPSEGALPYIGETWESVNDSTLARERCGHLSGRVLTSCLLGHRDPQLLVTSERELINRSSRYYDPEFADARREAYRLKMDEGLESVSNQYDLTLSEAKYLLSQGIPVVLDLDFFYGAWNHRKADEMGMGRDLDNWSRGIVGYPETGSVDRQRSYDEPAGHSVLAVGYDDDKVVRTRVRMSDGTTREFTYKGVIYFKNSWGTGSFGTQTEIEGKVYPGYGVITQRYAVEFGQFFQLPIESKR